MSNIEQGMSNIEGHEELLAVTASTFDVPCSTMRFVPTDAHPPDRILPP
jgi:hypothetical protein